MTEEEEYYWLMEERHKQWMQEMEERHEQWMQELILMLEDQQEIAENPLFYWRSTCRTKTTKST